MVSNKGWSAIPYVKAEPTEGTITEESVQVEELQNEEGATQQIILAGIATIVGVAVFFIMRRKKRA